MDIIKFYKVNEAYGFFSNFASYPILVNNIVWKTVEHYFQAQKFMDQEVRLKINRLDSPMKAASEGRNKKNILRSDWENVKESIMFDGLLCKFLQYPQLRKELILTGNATIVEHTKNDFYWADGGDGSGKNRLGILLMLIREEIKKKSEDPNLVLPPWIAFPKISQYDLFWRMGLGEEYLTVWAKYYLESDRELYRKLFPENKDWDDIYD